MGKSILTLALVVALSACSTGEPGSAARMSERDLQQAQNTLDRYGYDIDARTLKSSQVISLNRTPIGTGNIPPRQQIDAILRREAVTFGR